MRRRLAAPGVASALSLLPAVAAAEPPSGSLDAGFGRGGKVTTPIGPGDDYAFALAVQPDGKLIAAGRSNDDFALARYDANGSLDRSFGRGGKVTTRLDPFDDFANGLALQRDGKLVAAGGSSTGADRDSNARFALVRYDP